MQAVKKHIASILLAGFLFPQLAGSLHYLLVEHTLSSGNEMAFTKEMDYNYHSCVYHLNGFSGFLIFEGHSWKPQGIYSRTGYNFYSLENYVPRQDFNFQLRGPPQQKIYPI